MRAGRGDPQSDAFGRVGEFAPVADDFGGEFFDVRRRFWCRLYDRLVHLAFDVFAERGGARREELGDVRTQLPGVGIDDLEFFLDADGEPVSHSWPSGWLACTVVRLTSAKVGAGTGDCRGYHTPAAASLCSA